MGSKPTRTIRELIDEHRAQHRFWLIQRVDPVPSYVKGCAKGWFGNKYELDYMGSAEFEFGEPHKSLQRMRVLGSFQLREVQLARKGVTKLVYCVAPAEGFERKLEDFNQWASQDQLRAKEWTHFDNLFDEDFRIIERKYIQTVAWWSLHDDFLWSLDRETAEQLLYGLEHPATA